MVGINETCRVDDYTGNKITNKPIWHVDNTVDINKLFVDGLNESQLKAKLTPGLTAGKLNDIMKDYGGLYPILVRFNKEAFEEDFVEAGMIAYFTSTETHLHSDNILWYFTFPEQFDNHNNILLREYSNTRVKQYYSVNIESDTVVSDIFSIIKIGVDLTDK